MTKQMFRVFVQWSDGADVCIYADNEEEARERAVELMNQGMAHFELDQSNGINHDAVGTEKVDGPDDEEIGYAQWNEKNWTELEANEDACTKCGKSGAFLGGICESCTAERS